jgi:hypothetical protein
MFFQTSIQSHRFGGQPASPLAGGGRFAPANDRLRLAELRPF